MPGSPALGLLSRASPVRGLARVRVLHSQKLCVLALCCLGIALNLFIFRPALRYTADTDFLGLYPGGKLAGSPAVYQAASNLEVQRQATGVVNPQRLFIRPPFYAALLWPLAKLPYQPAFFLFQASMLVALALFVYLWRLTPKPVTLLACCWSTPLFASFAIGQDVPLLLAVVSLSYLLLRRQRDTLAGLVFSLCAIKPHLFLLLPVFVIARRMGHFAKGWLIGAILLLAISFLGAGPAAIPAFLHASLRPQVSPNLRFMPNLHGLANGSTTLELSAAILLAACLLFIVRRSSLEWAFAASLAASFSLSYHAYLADCALLLPAILVLLSCSQRASHRFLAILLLSPIPYVLVFAPPLILFTRLSLLLFSLSFLLAPIPVTVNPCQAQPLQGAA